MSDVPTRLPQDAPTPPVPRRPERTTDPVPMGKEPPTIAGDWLNLHQTVPVSSKGGNGNVPPSAVGSGSGFHSALTPGTSGSKLGSGSYIAMGTPLASSSDTGSTAALSPKMVGPYEIIKELGRGGMGVVYLAKDTRLKRPVALKMILAGAYADKAQRERFHTEAQAVAQLKHPNIVQIYEVGDYQGHPFLALEFFEGGNMRQVCAGQPQEHRWSAQVVKTLAEAMEYAHNRGVIHRDLKPANILLQKDDDNTQNRKLRWGQRFPASSYVRHSSVKITDFGLAKVITEAEHAQEPESHTYDPGADAMGTPQYMAPEQAQGERGHVGPATDIYSLGAILYDLLTGRPPFDGPTPRDTILRVLTEEALPPTKLQPKIPRDLETICLKCLQKEPSKRYPSASDLVADVRRFLTGEPILARRTVLIERGVKWAKRRPGVAGLVFGMVLVAIAALGVICWAMIELSLAAERERAGRVADGQAKVKAEEARQEAVAALQNAETKSTKFKAAEEQERRARQSAERKLYAILFNQAVAQSGARRAELLHRCGKGGGELSEDYSGWEWHFLSQPAERQQAMPRPAQMPVQSSAACVAVTSQGQPLVLVIDAQKKMMRCLENGLTRAEGTVTDGEICAAALSADGQLMAAGVWNGSTRLGKLLVWQIKDKKLKHTWELTRPTVRMAFDATGQRLGLVCRETSRVTGQEAMVGLADFASSTLAWSPKYAPDLRGALALAPQGLEVLAASATPGEMFAWSPGIACTTPRRFDATMPAVLQLSPDGQRLAMADRQGQVTLWDAVTGCRLLTLPAHGIQTPTVQLAFSPDGRHLAALLPDGSVLLWTSAGTAGQPAPGK
jgi:eukaryotic-like serine/threonine-protein kinase